MPGTTVAINWAAVGAYAGNNWNLAPAGPGTVASGYVRIPVARTYISPFVPQVTYFATPPDVLGWPAGTPAAPFAGFPVT